MRRQIRSAPSALCRRVDQMSGLQKAGPKAPFAVQLPPDTFDFGCEKGRVHSA